MVVDVGTHHGIQLSIGGILVELFVSSVIPQVLLD
jgi:hypothetical protein